MEKMLERHHESTKELVCDVAKMMDDNIAKIPDTVVKLLRNYDAKMQEQLCAVEARLSECHVGLRNAPVEVADSSFDLASEVEEPRHCSASSPAGGGGSAGVAPDWSGVHLSMVSLQQIF